MQSSNHLGDRRAFLRYLAASPILAYAGLTSKWFESLLDETAAAQDSAALRRQNEVIIKSVKEALNVFDFDAVARTKLSPAHYTFITDGSFKDVVAARGEPLWLAGLGDTLNEQLIRRIEATGCPTLVWTIDDGGANTIGAKSVQAAGVANLDREADSRCVGCHGNLPKVTRLTPGTPMDVLGAIGSLRGENSIKLNWDDVRRVRDMTRMKLVLKGIVTQEDAELCVRNGVDAAYVSNHGGHEDASGRGTIECLPEVLAGAGGKIPVIIDSGFRSGADAFKALALGATAVGIGRPHIWGLAAFGQEGVETVIELLRRELQVIMGETGAASIANIRRDSLVSRT